MDMRLKQIEELVQNECLLMGLPFEAFSDGKKAASMLFRMTGCFSSAVQGGVSTARNIGL